MRRVFLHYSVYMGEVFIKIKEIKNPYVLKIKPEGENFLC